MSERFKELKAYILDIRDFDDDPDADDPSRCKLWQGSRDSEGRGTTRFRGQLWNVPRLALGLFYQRWLKADEVVLHLCNNPACYRPSHLEIGTQAQNMQQMVLDRRARNQHSKSVPPDNQRGSPSL